MILTCQKFGIRNEVPLDFISFIGVPEDKVEAVKKMVGQKNIAVMPMPLNMDEKFYVTNDDGSAYIDYIKLKSMLENGKNKNKVFDMSAFKKLAEKLNIHDLKNALLSLKNLPHNRKKQEKGDYEI